MNPRYSVDTENPVKTFDKVFYDNYGDFQRTLSNKPTGQGGTIINNLRTEEKRVYDIYKREWKTIGGNDKLDELFKKEVVKYALHTGDKQLSRDELVRVLQNFDSDKNINTAYKSGETDSFLKALQVMLENIFGKITLIQE